MCTRRPGGLEARHMRCVDGVEARKPGAHTLGLGDGYRLGHRGAERRRDGHERIVELSEGSPVGAAGACPVAVHRLDGRLELETADALALVGAAELAFAAFEHGRVPAFGVLFLNRDQHALVV